MLDILDTLCPILKFHNELFSEIIRVLSSIIESVGATVPERSVSTKEVSLQDISQTTGCQDTKNLWSTQPNILAVVVSPSSDAHVKVMLAEPFHLDLPDRVRLADIQVSSSPLALRHLLIVDDSWARLKAKNDPGITWRSAEAAKEHHVLSLSHECNRVASLLGCISASSRKPIGPLEVLCVVDQSESERYGVPAGISGKVIFIVTKDREERPKAVALKTCIHWIDRLFLRSGYTLEWIHANVIPVYVLLPGSPCLNLAGQREDSVFAGAGIQLSAKRPLEACTRIKVREGDGAEVLEPGVLEEVERTRMFEAHAIHGPRFEELMGSMSLVCDTLVGNPRRQSRDDQGGSGEDNTEDDDNPFL